MIGTSLGRPVTRPGSAASDSTRPQVCTLQLTHTSTHAIIIDSVTALLTDTANQRALSTESMDRQELESMPLQVTDFHDEVRLALIFYYEGIVDMEGATGVILKMSFKRLIHPVKDIVRGRW